MVRPILDDENNEQGLINLGNIPSLAPVASFNPKQVENLIQTKGLHAVHYKHAPNPDRETPQAGVNPNTIAAKYARRFYEARRLRVVPQQFKLDNKINVQGIWGLGSVLLNVAGQYSDGSNESVFFRPYDIIVIERAPNNEDGSPGGDITTMVDQLAVYNPNGPLQLNFRIESVDYLADKSFQYFEGQDFAVANGKIVWCQGGRKPDFHDGKGAMLTIVYWTKPVYIVQNIPHSIRITPGNDLGTAALPRKATYAPQLVVAKQAFFRVDNEELLDFSDLPSYDSFASTRSVSGGSQ